MNVIKRVLISCMFITFSSGVFAAKTSEIVFQNYSSKEIRFEFNGDESKCWERVGKKTGTTEPFTVAPGQELKSSKRDSNEFPKCTSKDKIFTWHVYEGSNHLAKIQVKRHRNKHGTWRSYALIDYYTNDFIFKAYCTYTNRIRTGVLGIFVYPERFKTQSDIYNGSDCSTPNSSKKDYIGTIRVLDSEHSSNFSN